MKDSGVEWMGKIPNSWNSIPLKRFSRVHNGMEVPCEVSSSDINAIPVYGSGGIFKYTNQKQYKGTAVLFGRKGTLGKPIYVDDEMWVVDTMYYLTHNEGLIPRYNYYQLLTFDWEPWITHTAIPSIVASSIVSQKFPIPPLPEQCRIADFLDRKCTDIDNVLEKTRASIEEYRKLKQAVITEAVTKGIRGERPMKDSGIEWIGEIPANWKISKLRQLCFFLNGDRSTNYPSPDDYRDDGIPFCGADTLCEQYVNLSYARFISREKYNSMGGLKIQKGDILYTLRGSTIGKNAMALFNDGTVASSLMGIRINNSIIDSLFLLYLLNSSIESQQREICINGSTAPNLSADDVGAFKIPLPTIVEQQEIASYLDQKCSEIDSLIDSKERLIKELEAYRKSLIYEYVTGKKEVI